MTFQSNMTSKGQVTVPRDIRRSLGLEPGQPVEFVLNGRGEAVLRKPHVEHLRKAREADILKRVAEARAQFAVDDQMPGMTTDEYMEFIRGPSPEV